MADVALSVGPRVTLPLLFFFIFVLSIRKGRIFAVADVAGMCINAHACGVAVLLVHVVATLVIGINYISL